MHWHCIVYCLCHNEKQKEKIKLLRPHSVFDKHYFVATEMLLDLKHTMRWVYHNNVACQFFMHFYYGDFEDNKLEASDCYNIVLRV